MNEAEIKAAIISHSYAEGMLSRGSLIASEFAVDGHSRRADLAFFTENFIGIEIKSAFDTLRRLPSQVAAYQRYFDEVIAVIAERHVEKAASLLPPEVEVWVIADEKVSLFRKASERAGLKSADLAEVLRTDELKRLLHNHQASRCSRAALLEMASERSVGDIRDAVRVSLEKRYRSTSDAFWSSFRRCQVSEKNLTLLSRSDERRKAEAAHASAAIDFWSDWQSRANLCFGVELI